MEKELMRIKGFVPQSLLMAQDDEELEQLAEADASASKSEAASSHSGSKLSTEHSIASSGGSAAAELAAGPAHLRIGADALGDDFISRSSRRSDSIADSTKLSVTASALRTSRVAVAVINLRHFNFIAREITPELLVRVAELLASAGSEAAREFRGVLDSFSGDHFIFTFNAARLCPMMTQRACHSVVAFTKAIEKNKSVARIKELVQRQNSSALTGRRDSRASRRSTDGGDDSSTATQPSSLLHVCAGVATGMATVGNLGSKDIKRFSVVGEVFSRATELEAIANSRAPLPHEQCLPYSIFITSKDANDVEAAMNIEYVDYRHLRHARTLTQQQSSRAFAIARVLREHAAAATAGQDNEWMYAHQSVNRASDRVVEVRNLMFQSLDRGDLDEVQNLISNNPDVPSGDAVKHLSLSTSNNPSPAAALQ
jgi:class 3 adenylate cyclase